MEELRAWRKANNLSTDDAGKRVGVSGVQWHRYEAGTRQIAHDKLERVAAVTGLPVEALRPDLASIFVKAKPRPKPSQQERTAG